ncbi:MAG: class I SAM-dependent methyltransferase [Paludibacteraceae bacterium]
MDPKTLEDIQCRVCGNRDVSKFSKAYTAKDGTSIVKCSACDFVFIPPYYRKQIDYTEYKNEDSLKAVVAGNDWLKIQRHKLRYRTVRKYCKKGKLFDLGVGWGHFLYTGRLLGYEVEGIEMASMPFTYAKEYLNLPVKKIDFFDYLPKTDYYDVITLWDELEHIDLCDKAVEKCHTMLIEGGYLIFQVPQIDSYIAKKQKENWQAMGLDHVNYFSPDTAAKLLNSKGFEVMEIKSSIEIKLFLMYSFLDKKRKKTTDTPATQAERQEHFNKTIKRPKWQLKGMLAGHNLLYNTLSLLNIGDEMIVVARKKSDK